MSHFIQDYTKSQSQYNLINSMQAQNLQPIKYAGVGSTLAKLLTSYFNQKGMNTAQSGMDAAVKGRDDLRASDRSDIMSAFGGGDRNALIQSMIGSHDPGFQKSGMDQMFAASTAKPYTLGPGQTRFGSDNQELASGIPPKETKPTKQKLYAFAKTEGYTGSFEDFLTILSPKAVNINLANQTPGRTQLDKTFAKEYSDLVASGGFADITKQINQLKSVSMQLAESDTLTGPVIGMVPDWLQVFVNPKAVAAREDVEEVVQRNLRLILGAQFTEKEGERLIARAYNPKLGEAINKKRVDRLIRQMTEAAEAKIAAAKYFGENGTLTGFSGKIWTIDDFDLGDEVESVDERAKRLLGL